MSELAVQGFRAERDAIIDVAKSLRDEEWNLPSDCAGWSIRDVYGHMACTLHGVIDPAYLPSMGDGGTEQSMEAPVAERRAWTIEQVLDEYATYSAQAADAFAALQQPPMADTMLPMADLGTHPMSILPATFLFDAYTHLRVDVLKPFGAIDRPEPPRDEQRLGPTVEWMLAGLPWMCADALASAVRSPLVLELSGPGGGVWTITPGGEDGRVSITEGASDDAIATARSSSHDFVIWGTKRRPFADYVTIAGDGDAARAFLAAVNII